ncbi:germinal-center associated nuclear protein-like isoform X2 [Anneissia japonica]|uniref:germinal-center associated nuclear protein-like isoform X2 n=1 Tax=Anneissia japonica TaxID=1529436 RepID=UPI00142588BC|nr:germinal-center associated nuclear protein-like isoform X2 [Anneissia japonica]
MDDKDDSNHFSATDTDSKDIKLIQPFGRHSTEVSPFIQTSNIAPNVNPFATGSLETSASTEKSTPNLFATSFKPIFGFAGPSQPNLSSAVDFQSHETSGTQKQSNLFGGNRNANKSKQEPSIFGRLAPSKNTFTQPRVGEDSAGIGISITHAQQETDITGIDPETGGPMVTRDSKNKNTGLFTGRKIDLKKQSKTSPARTRKDEASARPRGMHDVPSSKRGRREDSDVFSQKSASRTISKVDNTFGDPSAVDISELEKFGARQTKSPGSSPRKKKSETRRGGIFSAALKGTGMKTEKKEILKKSQKADSRSQMTRQVSKSPDDNRSRISVRGIPDHLNNKDTLRRHFSQYGEVRGVYPIIKKQGATIVYRHHDAAVKAKTNGRWLERGSKPLSIFLIKGTRRATVSDEDGKEVQKVKKLGIKDQAVKREVSPRPLATPEKTRDKPQTVVLASETSMVVKQATYSANERYQVLVENDKLLRQALGNKKQENLSSASTVRGSCPDMCPEKERYMREVQRRVHIFEMIPGTDKNPQIDHAIAVKEYSRSSADQEAPLPHELRPPAVLNMTMNYLMIAIMDKGEGRWADWFDFVWNRTRGIRKDITQQHLCDLTAVDLVEKCARFHIYCAQRLCEAGTRVFDPKINNENLTKCLQSLKQFYADLDEEGTICPNEAEFRGYNVLLNLNQGDILREVQKYRFEVRQSSEVKFAVQVFTALNSNNYVCFFKLVKSATYLNACVLHRYFTQIRSSALETMVKAYSTARGGSYPLIDFVRQLIFEDEKEASDFCASHGLEVTNDDIIFESKSSFVRPSSAISARRAVKLIEAKNPLSIGQVVNNRQPLPPLEQHIQMTSFDSEGKFIGQHKMIPVTVEVVAPIVGQLQTMQKKEDTKQPEYTNEQVKGVAKELFIEVINEMCVELSTRLFSVLNHLMKEEAPLILENLLHEVTGRMILDTASVTYEQELLEERQRIEEKKEQIANEIRNEIVNKAVAEELLCIATELDREVKLQLKQASITRTTFSIHLDIVEETLQEELRGISLDTYAAAIEARRQRLAEIQQCVELIRVGRYFEKWKNAYAARIRLKRAMYEFPSAPASTSLKGQIETLLPFRSSVSPILDGNTMLVGKKAKMSLETPVSIIESRTSLAQSILQHHYLSYHQQQKAWAPFELPTILGQSLHQSDASISNQSSSHIYWKLVVSLPEDEQQTSGDAEIMCDWLEAKFTKGKIDENFKKSVLMDSNKVNTLSLYTSSINHRGYNKDELSICVKCVYGELEQPVVDQAKQHHQFLGTSAMILALEKPIADNVKYYWLLAQLRLKNILQAKPLLPAIPLLVCLLGWACSLSVCSEKLGLQELKSEGLLSAYKIQCITAYILKPRTSELLSEGVDWLALHQPKPPSLKQLPLRSFIDHGLMLFFTTSLYEDVKERKRAGISDQNPERVVELYNSVVCHLCQVATSPHLTAISWPVAEFAINNHESIDGAHLDWNSDSQMLRLKSRISSLQLPDPPDSKDNWYSACTACLQYVKMITGDPRSMAPLINRVKRLLERTEHDFENTCYFSFDESGCVPTADHIPWIKILELCISHKLAMLPETLQQQEDLDSDPHLFLVYYFESDLNNYKPPSVWKEATKDTADDSKLHPESISKSFYASANKKRAECVLLDETDGVVRKQIKVIPATIPIMKETSETVEDFKCEMMKEKEEIDRLDKLLAECTNDECTYNKDMMTDFTPSFELYVGRGMNHFPAVELTIEDKLQELRESIQRDRRANRLADLKIHSMLDG